MRLGAVRAPRRAPHNGTVAPQLLVFPREPSAAWLRKDRKHGVSTDLQTPFDVAIVMATVVRQTLAQAIRSIYAQQFAGRIQILVGIDRWVGERALLDGSLAECPSHVAVTQIDLGYSTSQLHGGLYPSHFGGSLKT